jgi:hypothetical protein
MKLQLQNDLRLILRLNQQIMLFELFCYYSPKFNILGENGIYLWYYC